ncbi:hypothetical protein HMPREF1147_2089 [Selenomonas sp. FOBRC9]|uniref:hypothetical protein n=1 Tax=Selenomonas sp. FOBRC9 TaxID=936573 RepID=UPI00027A4EBB|nr:hypothetical protein [Selenomonas sp. FOBRC9]EJP30161.1 hypothetical protein HMPREF1147_2089 [Selenomonas sp. FOBRC9]
MEVIRAIARRCRAVVTFCIGAIAMLAVLVALVFLYGLLIDGAVKGAAMALAAYAVYAILFL